MSALDLQSLCFAFDHLVHPHHVFGLLFYHATILFFISLLSITFPSAFTGGFLWLHNVFVSNVLAGKKVGSSTYVCSISYWVALSL